MDKRFGPEMFFVAAHSLFALAPRGYGRSSLRLSELYNTGSGAVVVHIYDDEPWVPFSGDASVWGVGGMGFHIHWDKLPTFFCAACELLREEPPMLEAEWAGLMAHNFTTASGFGVDGTTVVPVPERCMCPKSRWEKIFDASDVDLAVANAMADPGLTPKAWMKRGGHGELPDAKNYLRGVRVPPGSPLGLMEQRARQRGPELFLPSGIVENIARLVEDDPARPTAFTCFPRPATLRLPHKYGWEPDANDRTRLPAA